MSDETQVLEHQQAQREGAKRATLEKLQGKQAATLEFTALIDGEELSFFYRAVGGKRYDKMMNDSPATTEGLARGERFDEDKFSPKLLAAVCKEPELSEAQWADIWKSPDWSRGELAELVNRAIALCNKGFELAPTFAG